MCSIIVRDKNGELAGLCLNKLYNNFENKKLVNNIEKIESNSTISIIKIFFLKF